ncbi:MAG: glucose-1-phosphate cytidylyltransferase [Coxiellaceae bacterium]|nr:glucose-1-phosphate cytidylyltransferase [Coxiellaceae bacterium]
MKVVILCGGFGTRLSEETHLKPKPMVEVGGRPILWHIMKIYGYYDINNFVLALGYKGNIIKDYFLSYRARCCNVSVDMSNNSVEYSGTNLEDWRITMTDTGSNSLTGGRLLRLKNDLKDSGTFMLTYGDGVADINIEKLLDFHRSHGRLATVTAVRPSARFGGMDIDGNQVRHFKEKPQSDVGWVNGGFFVFEPGVFDYLDDDYTILEQSPLEKLVADDQLMAYKHSGYWQCMDTIRDRDALQDLWMGNNAPWCLWDKKVSPEVIG